MSAPKADDGLMSLHRAERVAKEGGQYDCGRFLALFPSGPRVCTWLDAYMGLFRIEGVEGFVRTQDMEDQFPDLQVICMFVDSEEA
jgi:hypothetical protein